MPEPAYVLAVIEVVYFSLMILPVLSLSAAYHKLFTLGWPLLVVFLVLQITGAALFFNNGKAGPPSITGAIISGVGLSPELLGIVGTLHQYAKLVGALDTKHIKTRVEIVSAVFHLGVATAVLVYAVGQSGKAQVPPKENAAALSKAGILLLLFPRLLAAMLTVWYSLTMLRSKAERVASYRRICLAVVCSMALLGIRIVCQTVVTLTNDPRYAAVGGDAVCDGCLQFLPSALVVLVLIPGGAFSVRAHKDAISPDSHEDAETRC